LFQAASNWTPVHDLLETMGVIGKYKLQWYWSHLERGESLIDTIQEINLAKAFRMDGEYGKYNGPLGDTLADMLKRLIVDGY
jgi:hypothetical protein